MAGFTTRKLFPLIRRPGLSGCWLVALLLLFPGFAAAQITLFGECNFQGQPASLPTGEYTKRDLAERGVDTKSISSMIVPEGFEIILYTADKFRGRSVRITEMQPCLESRVLRAITSIVVRPEGGEAAAAAQVTESAGRSVINVYSECDYRGRHVALEVGEYTAEKLAERGMLDNTISSLRVPEGMEVILYEHDFHRGRSAKARSDQDCLAERYNDQVSSLVVQGKKKSTASAQTASGPSIVVYPECNYRGTPVELAPREYSAAQLEVLGMPDNAIQSIRVPSGVEVIIYEHDFQRGRSSLVDQSISCLSHTKLHKAVSSVDVQVTDGDAGEPKVGVVVYSECEYRGDREVLGAGGHLADKLGVGDDAISSIEIPAGYSIEIFEHDNFSGGSAKLTESVECLSRLRADDLISSVIVSGPDATIRPTAQISRDDREAVDKALNCVHDYVVRDLCNESSWDVMDSFCGLDALRGIADIAFLEHHVGQGNCNKKYWDQLEQKVREPLGGR